MSTLTYKTYYKRDLPHIQPPGATFFVTFRLCGSLSDDVMKSLRRQSIAIHNQLVNISDFHEREKEIYIEQKRRFARLDNALHQSEIGPRWFKQQEIADIIVNKIRWIEQQNLYKLLCFCIMPNHVHILFTPLKNETGIYYSLSEIMHKLKRHTAFESNKRLNRTGQFWQHESYDHAVRDSEEQNRIIQYIINNPVKAGLAARWNDWRYTYCLFNL